MRTGSFVLVVLMAATSALAHHSNSAFDPDKVVVLKGTVTQWKWTNPHVWIFLSVDDGNGGRVQWEIEGRTPGQLIRAARQFASSSINFCASATSPSRAGMKMSGVAPRSRRNRQTFGRSASAYCAGVE